MSTTTVFLVYGASVLIAALFLYLFRNARWYWHALAVIAALVVGFIPTPEPLQTQAGTLAVGGIFLFLFLWGIGGPISHRMHHHKHA